MATALECPSCGEPIAHPRGADKLRFVRLPVLVVRVDEKTGAQALETVCPRCRRDVRYPLPLDVAGLGPKKASG